MSKHALQVRWADSGIGLVDVTAHLLDGQRSVLLRTDAHRDHICSNTVLEMEHLERARREKMVVLDNGDLFCAMQGPWDKRATQGAKAMRPQHRGLTDYFDALVRSNVEELAPYAPFWAVQVQGNHESAIEKHHGIDLSKRLIEGLRLHGCPGIAAGYSVYVRLTLVDGRRSWQRVIFMHHGQGSSAPVTRGTIQHNRRAAYAVDADIIFTGHLHTAWSMPRVQERVHGEAIQRRVVRHVQGPSYKDVRSASRRGWEEEKGFDNNPIGAYFLHFERYGDDVRVRVEEDVV